MTYSDTDSHPLTNSLIPTKGETMRTVKINVCKYEELSDSAKDKAREWWRSCESAEGYYDFPDRLESLTKFCEMFGYSVADYSVGAFCHSHVSIRSEFNECYEETAHISELSYVRLWKYLSNNHHEAITDEEYSLTGYWSDWEIFQPLREFMKHPNHSTYDELMNECAQTWLSAIVRDMEARYEDDYVEESIIANEYEFTEDGEHYIG